jgi:hypothetical protein
MCKRQVLALASALLVVGVLVAVSPAVAKRVPVDLWEVSCLVEEGMPWVADGMLHERGRIARAVFYDSDTFAVIGSDTIISNLDLNLATGAGKLFGVWSAIYLPVSGTGTFDGTWSGEGEFPPPPNPVSASARALGYGTGDLRGARMRLRLDTAPVPAELLEVLAADNPCSPDPWQGITHVTGSIVGLRAGSSE